MPLNIISADQRLAEKNGVKALILGPAKIGKTSLLRTLDTAKTLFVDLEAGDLAVQDVPVDTVRPRTWPEMRDLAAYLGGPNPALPDAAPYSTAHYNHVVETFGDAGALDKYETYFIDSITVASRVCMTWCQAQPDAFNAQGKPDPRGAYSLLGRQMIAWLTHLQHARGKNVIFVGILDQTKDDFGRTTWELQIDGQATNRAILGIVDQVITLAPVDFGDGQPVRAFVTKQMNPYGFPAGDRSGRLDEIEPPDLGALISKASDQKRQRAALSTKITPRADADQSSNQQPAEAAA
jgi:hypothetical protein